MSKHGYETGRLDLPFVGIATFAKSPYLADWDAIIGVDLTEAAPDYDHSGTTAILAAQLLMNLIGRIMNQRDRD